MARSVLDILIRLQKQGAGLKDTAEELETTAKKTAKTKSELEKLQDVFKKIIAPVGAAVVAFKGVEKALDFGRDGAVVIQTAQSFERLTQSLGASPTLIYQLRDAARNTIDDVSLMAGVTQLLAGASGDLAPALMNASPELMKIAEAASRLNPHLGDTAHMYESIGLGIKRASPMILDNLGITLKLGEAYDSFAKTLGKSADELTTAERSQAILNATLEAGNVLIQQAGESAESATEPFDQFQTSLSNLIDNIKVASVPALTALADGLTSIVTVLSRKNMSVYLTGVGYASKEAGGSLMDMAEAAKRAKAEVEWGADAKLFWIDMSDKVRLAADDLVDLGIIAGATWPEIEEVAAAIGTELDLDDWQRYIDVVGLANYSLALNKEALELGFKTQAEYNAYLVEQRDAEIAANVARWAAVDALANVESAAFHAADDINQLALAEWEAEKAAQAAKAAEDEFKASLDILHTAIKGEIGDAFREFSGDFGELSGKLVEMKGRLEELQAVPKALRTEEEKVEMQQLKLDIGETADEIDRQTAAFQRNTQEIIFNIAEKQILDALEKGLIEDVNASGTAFDEASVMIATLAEKLGLVDAGTLAFTEKVLAQTDAMINGEGTVDGWSQRMLNLSDRTMAAAQSGMDLSDAVKGLPPVTEIEIHTSYTYSGSPPPVGSVPGEPPPQYYQHGGQFMVRGPAGIDRVPVQFMATRGEIVTVTPVGGMPPQDPAITYNYNLNLTTSQPSMGVINDFNIMQSLAG